MSLSRFHHHQTPLLHTHTHTHTHYSLATMLVSMKTLLWIRHSLQQPFSPVSSRTAPKRVHAQGACTNTTKQMSSVWTIGQGTCVDSAQLGKELTSLWENAKSVQHGMLWDWLWYVSIMWKCDPTTICTLAQKLEAEWHCHIGLYFTCRSSCGGDKCIDIGVQHWIAKWHAGISILCTGYIVLNTPESVEFGCAV